MLSKILVPTDFSERARAVYPAVADYCRKRDAELVLAHSVQSILPIYSLHARGVAVDVPAESFVAGVADELKKEATRDVFDGVKLATELVYHSDPMAELGRFVAREKIDLCVTTTHGRSAIGRFLLGSYAKRLLREMSCPVLVWRGTGTTLQFERVVVPFDFSTNSRAVLPQVKLWSELFGSRFTFVHVVEPFPYTLSDAPGTEALVAIERSMAAAPERAQVAFDDLSAEALGGIEHDCKVCAGNPAEEIVKTAEATNADLILTATHGATGWTRLALGSVAEHVVATAPCSVMTVRSRPEEAE